jgi:membrane protein
MAKIVNNLIVIFNAIKWPITFAIVYFNIKLIYTIAPDKDIKSSDTTYGALITTVLWVISTLIFKLYITYLARYDIIYGNLSSIIITMIWLYLLSYIFVFGMAFNANKIELEDE